MDFAAKEEASIDCLSPCSEEFQSWSISNETGEEDTHSATMQLESNSFSFTAAGFKVRVLNSLWLTFVISGLSVLMNCLCKIYHMGI